ncbi:regulator of G- signaling 14 isoform X1 [Pelobates cultripes]|uniref:Regulator of G-protein signaling 14 n=1 Tax=Pelobates cultripes TaxID=61616 RepID=A0AAD1VZ33_PELCU|nr:regulator of G- signaling 14 isoform X1 [Pelobates cultripes]
MEGKMKYLDVPNGRLVLAVSDGELNNTDIDGRGSDQSLNSLPSVRSSGLTSEHSVASWAVSFERLLEDPLGVEYFTEFLKKEYSAENIFFWKACEQFQNIPAENTEQLLKDSQTIYNEFLSSSSLCPVNVDQQAIIKEDMLKNPFPDMFKAQQMQIFSLMKFDSYARFVKSSLYQECMLSEVEGRPLPSLTSSPTTTCISFSSGAVKKKLRPGKSLPLGVEATGVDNTSDFISRPSRRSFKKKDKKGSCRELSDSNELSSRRESQTSLNSTTSLDHNLISSLSSKFENDSASLGSIEHDSEAKPMKYCCVYLPDGTASLAAVKPGLTIRDMLAGICEKRGYCVTDVKVYLSGNEQKPLALDQECKVLADQEVKLENRIGFDLQIKHVNKNVRIVSKPTKTIQEALQPTLKKYELQNCHIVLHKAGDSHCVEQGSSVLTVSGQKLILEVTDKKDSKNRSASLSDYHSKKDSQKEKLEDMNKHSHNNNNQGAQKEADHTSHIPDNRHNDTAKVKYKSHRQTYDFEGLVEMLNKVQHSRTENQRGLLTKEDLELPEFLKLPSEVQCDNCHIASLDGSIEVPKMPPPTQDASLDSEIEHRSSTEIKPSSIINECSTGINNHVTVKDSASLTDETQENKEMIHTDTISDSDFLNHTSPNNDQICTEDLDSAL